ncbi:hypothetical protein ATKI12_5800 [Kitasatospora sp. Ki12]
MGAGARLVGRPGGCRGGPWLGPLGRARGPLQWLMTTAEAPVIPGAL